MSRLLAWDSTSTRRKSLEQYKSLELHLSAKLQALPPEEEGPMAAIRTCFDRDKYRSASSALT